MRHIPEEELHAHLDQALSRSQCIEIETHLAGCGACRRQRDQVAALRDRTTAILAAGALRRRTQAPPWPLLSEQAGRRRRADWRRQGLLAASIAGALVAGWGMRALLDPHGAAQPLAEGAAVMATMPAAAQPAAASVGGAVTEISRGGSPRLSASPVRLAGGALPRRADATPVARWPEAPETGWTEVSLPEAAEATGSLVATLPDLVVESVRLQPVSDLERPLLAVTHRRSDGEVLVTVEGPVAQVARLVAGRRQEGWTSSAPSRSLPDYLEVDGTVRRTSRVVTLLGRLPTDTLEALAQSVVIR